MPTLTLTQTDNNQSFNVKIGDQIVIRLQESPTTGYRWVVDHGGEESLVLQKSDFSPAGSGVGGGGERAFTFAAQNPGLTHVSLNLWRDWEGSSSISNRFDVPINVS